MNSRIRSLLEAKLRGLLESRRFWATVASVVTVLFKDEINTRLGISLTDEQILTAVFAVGTWIIGDSINKTTVKVK